MKYVYPAIFTSTKEGFLVRFPDLESCYTDGEDMKDAFINAEDVLNLVLWNMEESKNISCDTDSFISLVSADTLAYRKLHDTKAVKKTLSIPRWLDTMALEKNVNFSNILQNALINELGINVEKI